MRIYTDGGCRQGVGGWAWWCEDTDESRSGSEVPSTNQRMELRAALEAINEYYDYEITIVSDSAYLVNCFGEKWWAKWLQNGWFTRKGEVVNRDLWEPMIELVENANGRIKFEKVPGHAGIHGNEWADLLCTREIEKAQGQILSEIEEAKRTQKKMGKSNGTGSREDRQDGERRDGHDRGGDLPGPSGEGSGEGPSGLQQRDQDA